MPLSDYRIVVKNNKSKKKNLNHEMPILLIFDILTAPLGWKITQFKVHTSKLDYRAAAHTVVNTW